MQAEGTGTPEPYTLAQRCLAEALGVGIIVTGGCGAVCAAKYAGAPLGHFGIASAFGLSVALAVYATRDISGAHLNPAITASLFVNADCPAEDVAPYCAAQMVGATVGALINYAAYNRGIAALEATEKIARGSRSSSASFAGAFGMVPNKALVRTPGALLAEVAMTAALAFMVFAISDGDKSVPGAAAPALVGATVATIILPGGPITGCGMNPARDLGPRLVTAATGWGAAALSSGWWVYSLGPVLGGILGGALYNATMRRNPDAAESRDHQ